MAEAATPGVGLYQVARIVSSYVRHHQLGPDQLIGLIVAVHRALAGLGLGPPPLEKPPEPAVPIRRSVQRDYVVCLECGFRGQALAVICGCSTSSRLLRIVPAGIYRPITQ